MPTREEFEALVDQMHQKFPGVPREKIATDILQRMGPPSSATAPTQTAPGATTEPSGQEAGLVESPGGRAPDLSEGNMLSRGYKSLAEPATRGVESVLGSVLPESAAKFGAKMIVPQDLTELGITAALALVGGPAGGALGKAIPGVGKMIMKGGLKAAGTRIAASAAGGAAGSFLEGDSPASGAVSGALGGVVGEGVGAASKLIGQNLIPGVKGSIAKKDAARMGKAIEEISPELGGARTSAELAEKFLGGEGHEAVRTAFKEIVEGRVGTVLKKNGVKELNLPQLQMFFGRDPTVPISWQQAIDDFSRIGPRAFAKGELKGTVKAGDIAAIRAGVSKEIKDELTATAGPRAAKLFETGEAVYSKGQEIIRLFTEKGVFTEGKFNLGEMQEVLGQSKGAGKMQTRARLSKHLGKEDAGELVRQAHRGATPEGIDKSGSIGIGFGQGGIHIGLPHPRKFVGEPPPMSAGSRAIPLVVAPKVGGGIQPRIEGEEKKPQKKISMSQTLREGAKRHGLDESVVLGIGRVESGHRPEARGSSGERGVMQVLPGTAKSVGIKPEEMDDPNKQVEAGTRYLAKLKKMFKGDIDKAVAAYNAGPGRVFQAIREAGEDGDWKAALRAVQKRVGAKNDSIGYLNRVKAASKRAQDEDDD